VKKFIAVGEMIVFCVMFCRSVIVLFLLAIVLPALALGDLNTLLALFLKQKRVRKFCYFFLFGIFKLFFFIFLNIFGKKFRLEYDIRMAYFLLEDKHSNQLSIRICEQNELV
jgi:hypothetical protein